jgi:putative Holliday junction resolvase
MDGREGGQSARSRQLAIALKASYPGLDVRLYDERLTTKAAQERLLDLGLSEPERRRLRDSFAALVLLEDWILSGEPPGAP